MAEIDDDPLANPFWHALTGRQAALARGSGDARSMQPDVGSFSAIREPNEAAYADLARLLGPGGEARLVRPDAPEHVPDDWEIALEAPLVQMAADGDPPGAPEPPDGFTPLGPDDADEMLALATLTNPGPFELGTVRLGGYLGVRRNGKLIAMAGHRLRPPGHTEISAICTAPEYRGQGLARTLTLIVMQGIHVAGETPILHLYADNEAAHGLYLKLGFQNLRRLTFRWLRAPG